MRDGWNQSPSRRWPLQPPTALNRRISVRDCLGAGGVLVLYRLAGLLTLLTILLMGPPAYALRPSAAENPPRGGLLDVATADSDSADSDSADSDSADSDSADSDSALPTRAISVVTSGSTGGDETTTDDASEAPGGLPVVASIDAAIERGWANSQLSPSAAADEREFCRRVFLDLLGRIPTVDELQQYASDRRPDRKRRLVHRLLYDASYTIDYARHWSTVWANLLIGRSGGQQENGPVSRAGLTKFLRDCFANNRPYDAMVRELIAAEGANRPGAPGFHGAVNFLAGKLDDKATQATAQTAKLFLGLQVQCTQCHNHPFNEWKQNQFWELNSFFRQATVLRRFKRGTREVNYHELANQDFAGEDRPREPRTARVYYELRNGVLQAAFPVFVDGTEIDRSGLLEAVDRRTELAKLVVQSPYLSRAIVNRMWSHFLGFGFTRPVDDMGPHNPPQYPELLNQLAQEFAAHSFDLKQLMTWIVLSRPYGLSSRTHGRNASDDPALGEPPRFSRFYCRQMTAEQLYRSLLIASRADQTHGSMSKRQAAQRQWLEQFIVTFGTDEGGESTTFDGTITQTLMMFNGELMKRATDGRPGSFLHQIAHDPQQRTPVKINQLYLAALARRATSREQQAFQDLVAYHQGDRLAALQDLWWAVLNSNEFIINH